MLRSCRASQITRERVYREQLYVFDIHEFDVLRKPKPNIQYRALTVWKLCRGTLERIWFLSYRRRCSAR